MPHRVNRDSGERSPTVDGTLDYLVPRPLSRINIVNRDMAGRREMRGDIVEIGECISLVAIRPCASGVHLDCVSFPVTVTVGAGSLELGRDQRNGSILTVQRDETSERAANKRADARQSQKVQGIGKAALDFRSRGEAPNAVLPTPPSCSTCSLAAP
jgi:hypothetical protein